jgi:hypothetical protein
MLRNMCLFLPCEKVFHVIASLLEVLLFGVWNSVDINAYEPFTVFELHTFALHILAVVYSTVTLRRIHSVTLSL